MRREMIVQGENIIDLTSETLDNLRVVSDHCQRLRSSGLTGDKDMRVLAHVPGFMIEKWCNDHGITFAAFMRDNEIQTKMLNDPDMKAFRVYEGRV